MVRIASFNVENLFSRPRALKLPTSEPNPYLKAYGDVNDLMAHPIYTDADKAAMIDALLTLEIYYRNKKHAIRKNPTRDPHWAWLRMNRGKFDRQPEDETKDVEIIATGRADWIGWVELAKEAASEVATRMTARVIRDIGADIQALVECEDRPTLVRFNEEILGGLFAAELDHVMLLDGNDDRGIDVGLMTKAAFEVRAIRSSVDVPDPGAPGEKLFSRDCADYEIKVGGKSIRLLINHFKSQSGGGGAKRLRQSTKVREIVDGLVGAGKHVIVLGDFNEGQPAEGQPPTNLPKLFEAGGPLTSVWDLPAFDKGPKPGTFDNCSISNRLDYILLSPDLVPKVAGGAVFRKGLWGSTRKTRPTAWETYPEMTVGNEQASDHAAIYVDLNL